MHFVVHIQNKNSMREQSKAKHVETVLEDYTYFHSCQFEKVPNNWCFLSVLENDYLNVKVHVIVTGSCEKWQDNHNIFTCFKNFKYTSISLYPSALNKTFYINPNSRTNLSKPSWKHNKIHKIRLFSNFITFQHSFLNKIQIMQRH